MAVSEVCPIEGSIPFISDARCKIGKLTGSQQDNILLNAREIGTISDEQEKEDSVDKALSPESNEAPLTPPISEDKLQSEQNYGLCDIGQESWRDAYPENNWNSTMDPIVSKVTQNHWETEAYSEPGSYPISHATLPDIGSHNDEHNFDEVSYKDEKNMSAKSNGDQKSNTILLDADFLFYPISTREILNEFGRNVSEEPNSDDVKSSVVHHHRHLLVANLLPHH